MDSDHHQDHWQRTYQTKSEHKLSWHQELPEPSFTLVTTIAASLSSPIIDIGGGTSHLVDHLVQRGYGSVTVLDLSSVALAQAQARLGEKSKFVEWIATDITAWAPPRLYEVWHDRATFHFMVSEADCSAYLARMKQVLAPGGHAIIGTFALDGPERCSGLPVMRYDPAGLASTLGREFVPVSSQSYRHQTPSGGVQAFQFSVFKRRPEAS
ncbi:class I SAM-dependent methyltransferase [Leptospira interrogans]